MKCVFFFETPLAKGKTGRAPEERMKAREARKDEKKYGKTILEGHFHATGKVYHFNLSRAMGNYACILICFL